jgi:hypothetical protein
VTASTIALWRLHCGTFGTAPRVADAPHHRTAGLLRLRPVLSVNKEDRCAEATARAFVKADAQK